ncbi:Fpg/Nei family DNA glycosylase [Corynebacterium lizhenjunii]|uniref:DNA-(apurinic or apyrimidinic site) lyase n=1 Tax=Corynebacterium lizhenjunii TaxID=2709394 RepID=A0A7T0P9Q8_9CORY|nr:Fpg/Nei family DNA glycosylase [Corynebacterium lizhenjunii]QPK79078.1 Fpg/Nei family DNA glycosylase [Corynebacterium lizhenjunii]
MPEGHLIHHLAGRLNTDFRSTPLHVTSPQGRFAREAAVLDGTRLERAEARGKHLFLHFDAPSPEHIVYIHLGLIGQLRFEPVADVWGQVRLRLEPADAAEPLAAQPADADASPAEPLAANLRGPQWCRLITPAEYAAAVAKIGHDPIRADADPQELWAQVQRSSRSIASLLMDQKLFAGVGNIYRAEVLFRQGIAPTTPGKELTRAQFDAVWADLVDLMRAGVDSARIDTVRPEHTPEAMGRAPRKDDHGGEVYVYRREGLPCYVCSTPVAARVLEGRNLFWCPACQRG